MALAEQTASPRWDPFLPLLFSSSKPNDKVFTTYGGKKIKPLWQRGTLVGFKGGTPSMGAGDYA
jgi:hypothetical protein